MQHSLYSNRDICFRKAILENSESRNTNGCAVLFQGHNYARALPLENLSEELDAEQELMRQDAALQMRCQNPHYISLE